MISVVVSSYQPLLLEALKINVRDTIDVPYEFIVIENKAIMGICEAYNLGASKAKFDLLCFIHEDIQFASKEWGRNLVELFTKDKDLALAGLAGSKYKPKFVTGWTTSLGEYDRMHILQSLPNKNIITHTHNPNNELYSEVITLDGVCLFITKNCWKENKFNEELKGFHFYDLDLSLRISSQYKKVAVIYFIDVIHFSMGRFNDKWVTEAFKFHRNKNIQSILKKLFPKEKDINIVRKIKYYWIYRLQNENISLWNRIKLYITDYRLFNRVNFISSVIWFSKLMKHNIYTKYKIINKH